MKNSLTSIELHYIVKELQFLIDSKVDKIYHPKKEELIVQFYVSSKGKSILRIVSGKYMYIADSKEEYGEPSGFCMTLRKNLGGARLRRIKQLGSERIVEFLFEKKDGKHKLYFEFFGGGNIVLCDDKDMIKSAIVYDEWKDRAIRPRLKYEYPRKQLNFFELNPENIGNLLKRSRKDSIVTSLAVELGLGGNYSEEVCRRAGIAKGSKPKSIDEENLKLLSKEVNKIVDEKISARQIFKDGKVKDVVPFKLKIFEGLEEKTFESYNMALADYFSKNIVRPLTKNEKDIEKIKRVIDKQKETIKSFEVREKEERRKAELIYDNYKLVEEILTEIKKAVDKYSWKEIKDKLKGHKVIKEINSKDKKVVVDI